MLGGELFVENISTEEFYQKLEDAFKKYSPPYRYFDNIFCFTKTGEGFRMEAYSTGDRMAPVRLDAKIFIENEGVLIKYSFSKPRYRHFFSIYVFIVLGGLGFCGWLIIILFLLKGKAASVDSFYWFCAIFCTIAIWSELYHWKIKDREKEDMIKLLKEILGL